MKAESVIPSAQYKHRTSQRLMVKGIRASAGRQAGLSHVPQELEPTATPGAGGSARLPEAGEAAPSPRRKLSL